MYEYIYVIHYCEAVEPAQLYSIHAVGHLCDFSPSRASFSQRSLFPKSDNQIKI